MTQDEIIEMARQAGFQVDEYAKQFQPNLIFWGGYSCQKQLEAFAKLVADKKQEDIIQIIKETPFSNWFQADVIEAIREHAMYEVQRLGQEIEQEPVAYKWSDAGDLKLLKKGDVLRVLRKGQEYYRAFKFCGAIEECDYAYDGNAPFAWLLVGMAYTDKIVYTRKNFSTGAVYADRGDVVEIRQPINYPTHPQRTEQEPVDYEKLAALGWQAIECGICGGGAMGYPQRTWVGLTIDEREQIQQECFGKVPHHVAFAHAIEAKLKQKNGFAEEKNND